MGLILNPYVFSETFPPAGTVVIDGDLPNSTNWDLRNGSTIGSNVASIVANGAITSSTNNHSLRQDNIFTLDLVTTYEVKFWARQVTGSGAFQAGRNFAPYLNQVITGSFVQYTVTFAALDDVWAHGIAFGGVTVSDTFEVKEISAVEI